MDEKIKVVIGAGYGDEGKGKIVAHLAKPYKDRALVVFPNGSAQRAHTVVDGAKRHVFHHFGSGTLSGAHTYCASSFVVHPIVFRKEWQELEELGVTPKVFVNFNCDIATPWDMLVNQVWETSLGDNRYGSCGLGVYEAIERSYDSAIHINGIRSLIVDNLTNRHFSESLITDILTDIQTKYMPKRIKEVLNGKPIPEEYVSILEKDYVGSFLEDLKFFKDHVTIIDDVENLPQYDCIIFECGQGLAIQDTNKCYGENVTPSNTGIINPILGIRSCNLQKHLRDNSNKNVEVIYTTRWYTTRHGAGNLRDECKPEDLSPFIEDKTNIPNPWQQSIRYAPLDLDMLVGRIARDLTDVREIDADIRKLSVRFAINCLDQFDDTNGSPITIGGITQRVHYEKFKELFYWCVESFMSNDDLVIYQGYGEDINKVYQVE